MKKLIFFLLAFFITSFSYSQPYWFGVNDTIPDLVIMSMQFTSANTGYASGSYHTVSPGAFLRTTNAGLNWQVTQLPRYSSDDICFLDDNTGYFIGWNGISYLFKTTNGGDNWIMQTGTIWHEPSSLCCIDADTWLVTDGGGEINKTTNGGENWNRLIFYSIGMNGVALHFINSTTGFCVSNNGSIFKTTNAGDNWFIISNILESDYYHGNIMFVNENTGYISSRRVNSGVFKTTNGGYNWTAQNVTNYYGMNYLYFINPDTGFVGGG